MEKNFQELLTILDEEKYSFNGLLVYLLSNEEEPYKLYKLNLSTNEDIENIIERNVENAKDAQLYEYQENTKPDGVESISFIKEKAVPEYDNLKKLLNDDISSTLSKSVLNKIVLNIKGYVICATFTEKTNGEEFEVKFYSTMDKSKLYEPKAGLYRFGGEQGDVLKKSQDVYLEFTKKLCAINFNGDLFVINGHFFDRLFRYDEHINLHATTMVTKIGDLGLISNCDILKEHCGRNKNFKSKLYAISAGNKLDKVTFQTFSKLKKTIGEGLLFTVDSGNETVTIDESNSHKSVDQIIRIINDETAKTYVSETQIFANQRIRI